MWTVEVRTSGNASSYRPIIAVCRRNSRRPGLPYVRAHQRSENSKEGMSDLGSKMRLLQIYLRILRRNCILRYPSQGPEFFLGRPFKSVVCTTPPKSVLRNLRINNKPPPGTKARRSFRLGQSLLIHQHSSRKTPIWTGHVRSCTAED